MKRVWLLLAVLLVLLLIPLWIKKGMDERAALTVKAELQQTNSPPQAPPVEPASSTVAPRPIGFGLTFALVPLDDKQPPDTASLNCHGEPRQLDRPHQDSCNPYQGDTTCRTVLPVLCVKPTGAAKPEGVVDSFYQGWVSGSLAATAPVMGAVLESLEAATARCVAELGPGWRMAEFHDGQGGWGLSGQKASDFSPNTRYWVYVNDQRGNCWDSEP
ncbi:hypothetical protein HUU62_25240 [Rhodoferax sp. 4810]|nr:hypothetical protein [Rhodoferax jenense]